MVRRQLWLIKTALSAGIGRPRLFPADLLCDLGQLIPTALGFVAFYVNGNTNTFSFYLTGYV